METQSIKSKPRKYTEELIFEIISYVHDEIESKTFSYEKMYTKYPTTSGIFLTILKRQGVILSNRSTNFWIGAKPSLDLANLVKEIYIKEYRLNAVKHKERREKLAEHKKHLQSIEEAEKVLKSEELELESSTLYKKVVNEKDYNQILGIEAENSNKEFSELSVKAENLSKTIEELEIGYKTLKDTQEIELRREKEKYDILSSKFEELNAKYVACDQKRLLHFTDLEFLKIEIMEYRRALGELSKKTSQPKTQPDNEKKFIKILGIKFYVK